MMLMLVYVKGPAVLVRECRRESVPRVFRFLAITTAAPLCDSACVYVDAAVRTVCFYAHRLPFHTLVITVSPLTSREVPRPSSAATSLPDTSTALLPTPQRRMPAPTDSPNPRSQQQ
jgi:hypothetical protein